VANQRERVETNTEKIYLRTAEKEIGPFTLEEAALCLATGQVKELSPARLEGEETSRALKFHPIYAKMITIQVKIPKPDKKAAGPKPKHMESNFKPETSGNVKALIIILVLIALIPLSKFGLGLLSNGKAKKEADAFNLAFSSQASGDTAAAQMAYVAILEDEKNVEDGDLLYRVRTHLAVIILDKNTMGAIGQLRKIPRGVAVPNADTEFAKNFSGLFSKQHPGYQQRYWDHRKKFPDHYPGLVADAWLYAGKMPGIKANPGERQKVLQKISSLNANPAAVTDAQASASEPSST
jgi:hypothetical protein